MNQYLIGGTVILLVVFGLASYGWVEHNRFLKTKAEYSEFIAKTEALAEKARTDNLKKEMEYAKKVADAVRARDRLTIRMRELAKSASGSLLPGATTTTGNAETTCYNRAGLDTALSRFEEGIKGLLTEGDEAVINTRVWLASWPD